MKKREITLCSRCLIDYKNAGYDVKPDLKSKIKSPCEICSREGYDYYFYEQKPKSRDKRPGA